MQQVKEFRGMTAEQLDARILKELEFQVRLSRKRRLRRRPRPNPQWLPNFAEVGPSPATGALVQLTVTHEGKVSPYEQKPIYKPRQINDKAGPAAPIAARRIGSACPKPKQHCFAIRLKHLSGFANSEEYSIAFRHDRGIGQPALEKVRDKVKLPRPARRQTRPIQRSESRV